MITVHNTDYLDAILILRISPANTPSGKLDTEITTDQALELAISLIHAVVQA